jgi:uncharacterized protein
MRLPKRKSLVLMLGICGVAYAAFISSHAGDRLILFPQTGPVFAQDAREERIPFRHGQLEIWKARSREAAPVAFVLRFYGNSDRADRWVASEAHSYAEHALEFWGVNYPGFGGSSGPVSLEATGAAALAAYEALEKVAGGLPIFLFGTSLGTTAALGIAAQHPVAGLVLQNPPPLPELIRGNYGWWNLWLLALPVSVQIPPTLDSRRNALSAYAPALFLTSENDEIVPPRFQQMLFDAYAGPKVRFLLSGARHNDAVAPAIDARVKKAFATMLNQARVLAR